MEQLEELKQSIVDLGSNLSVFLKLVIDFERGGFKPSSPENKPLLRLIKGGPESDEFTE